MLEDSSRVISVFSPRVRASLCTKSDRRGILGVMRALSLASEKWSGSAEEIVGRIVRQ